jgi:hypothetical protein
MGKVPASLFYWGDFVRDPDLRRCTNTEVGVWIRLLCLMYEAEYKGMLATNGVPWTDDEVALAIGGSVSEAKKAVTALVTKGVASRLPNGALINRRMYREHSERLGTRQRVQNFRLKEKEKQECNATVTDNVTPCTETEYERNTSSVNDLNKSTTTRETASSVAEQEEEIYLAYPRKVGRGPAMKAIRAAVTRLTAGSLAREPMEPSDARTWLWGRATAYAGSPVGARPNGEDFRPYPATWFNGERYFDDDSEWSGNGKKQGTSSPPKARINSAYDALDREAERKGWSTLDDPFAADGPEVPTPGSVGVDGGPAARFRGAGDEVRPAPGEGRAGGSANPSGPEILPPTGPSGRGV